MAPRLFQRRGAAFGPGDQQRTFVERQEQRGRSRRLVGRPPVGGEAPGDRSFPRAERPGEGIGQGGAEGARLRRRRPDRAAGTKAAVAQRRHTGGVELVDGVGRAPCRQGALEAGSDLLRSSSDAGGSELVLTAREVVIERAGDGAARRQDVLHACPVVAAVGEKGGGGVEQAGTAVHGWGPCPKSLASVERSF